MRRKMRFTFVRLLLKRMAALSILHRFGLILKTNLIGKHRKMRCSSGERLIWGDGEGSMFPVMDTEIGRLGGLLCWEHLVPSNLAVMNGLNEQVHVASWPNCDVLPNDTEIASRYYAMSTQTFVLQCASFLTDEAKKRVLCKSRNN